TPFREARNRCRRKDGREVWVISSGIPVLDEEGSLLGFRGSDIDVTELVLAEWRSEALQEKLYQTRKMNAVGKLAGGISHKLNNLMTTVIGFSQVLLKNAPENSGDWAALKEIHLAGERAAQVVGQLMLFSRVQFRSLLKSNINEVIMREKEKLKSSLGDGIRLATVLDPTVGEIPLSFEQLAVVLSNLLENSREASPDGGRVTVRTSMAPEREGGGVVLTVTDDGMGMDEETRSRAFEPFYSTRNVASKSGLGLSTVYGIVRQNGGDIEIRGKPGRGTTVILTFPLASPRPSRIPGND
ncbi:MAG: two-component system sensor histidine kinase NtrB, partial [Planctomycetota bacterium]